MKWRPDRGPTSDGGPEQLDCTAAFVERSAAVLRMFLLVIILVGTHWARRAPAASYFDELWTVAAIYSLTVFGIMFLGRRPTVGLRTTFLFIDLLLIAALAYASGQAFPQIRAMFIVAPLIAAIQLSPRWTAATSVIASLVYIIFALAHRFGYQLPVTAVLAHGMFVAWSGAAAVVVSIMREQRERRIHDLARARGRLVAQIMDGEERANKRISDILHDHVIQDLITARHDLTDSRNGDPTALDRVGHAVDQALVQLRSTIEDLNPYLLEHLDLASALRVAAERSARDAYRLDVNIQPGAAGVHDALIASVTRELLNNAAKHARPSSVRLDLARDEEHILLEITDDGRGFTPAQAISALKAGHIGLAAIRERLEAIGGSLQIQSAPGHGTTIRCRFPASPMLA